MYFQALDDKKHCVGIYYNGNLIFDQEKFPKNLSNMRTWKYSGFLDDDSIKYGWLLSEGKTLLEACPEELKPQLKKYGKKMNAFKKSFELAKIDFREHCFFDLVPHDFLQAFLEFKNQVTAHVFETHEQLPMVYITVLKLLLEQELHLLRQLQLVILLTKLRV